MFRKNTHFHRLLYPTENFQIRTKIAGNILGELYILATQKFKYLLLLVT